MSTFSTPQKSGSLARIRRLASSLANGKAYERRPDVEAEIQRVLRLHQSAWIAEAEDLQNETLVFLIRQIDRGDEELFGRLLQELSKRTVRIASRWAQGLDPIAAEEIVLRVEMQILELVLAETASRQSDFLEVAFGKAVEVRTINAVRNHNGSAMGRRAEIVADTPGDFGDEFDEMERPLGLAVDDRPGPEAILLQLEDEARRDEWIQKAYDAVRDLRHLEAVILHYGCGWPITSKDPSKPDLARHFGAKPRQIKYWIATALEAMRETIGEQK